MRSSGTKVYRLGQLPLEPGFGQFIRLAWHRLRKPGELRADFEQVVRRVSMARAQALRAPDLLQSSEAHRDGWLWELHEAILELNPSRHLPRLVHCERRENMRARGDDGGHVALAFVHRTPARTVRVGDEILGGFAVLRAGDGELSIWPRVHRVICSNGAALFTGRATEALATTGGLNQALGFCLSPERLAEGCQLLQEAARTSAPDPVALLEAAVGRDLAERVWSRREEHDASVFGVLNALTAHARERPEFVQRLELERRVEDVLEHAGLLDPRRATRAAPRAPVSV